MVEPRLGILTPILFEIELKVFARVRSNFGEPLGFPIVKLPLIHQIPKRSHAFNGGKASFNPGDRVGSASLNLEVVGYK